MGSHMRIFTETGLDRQDMRDSALDVCVTAFKFEVRDHMANNDIVGLLRTQKV